MLTMACLQQQQQQHSLFSHAMLTHYLLAQFTEPAMLHTVVALISLYS